MVLLAVRVAAGVWCCADLAGGVGITNITNLALICPYDLHLITDTGHTVGVGPHGRIQWTPPPRLDPDHTAAA